jgi:V8-like Glu-specific endopeptidase
VKRIATTSGLLLAGLVLAGSEPEAEETLCAPCAPGLSATRPVAMYHDTYTAVSKTEPLFSGIGMVVGNRNEGSGTAFLVSSCHVLTNYHVLYARHRPDRWEKFQFVYGEADSPRVEFLTSVSASPVVLGTYYEGTRTCEDFALLELETCLGAEYSYVDLLPLSLDEVQVLQGEASAVGLGVSSAGYPDTEAWDHVSVDRACTVDPAMHAGDVEAYSTTCNSVNGVSGGPLFVELPEQERLGVFGMIKGGAEEDGLRLDALLRGADAENLALRNRAVPIACIYDRIKDYLPGREGE